MPLLRQAGISPAELDNLVAGERWGRWCQLEPGLSDFDSLAAVRCLRGEAEDVALGALLRITAPDVGDDELAAVAVLHQLGGSLRVIVRHHQHLCDDDIEGIVVGAMWDQIRSFDWRGHPCRCAAVIYHGTRKAVRAVLMPDATRWRSDRVVLLNPQSWLFEVLADADEGHGSSLDLFDARDQLAAFFRWATNHGFVDQDDLKLLVDLMALDRANPDIPKWLRGACSMASIEHVAHERGVCWKSVARARDRVLARLREAAPTFLDEVA